MSVLNNKVIHSVPVAMDFLPLDALRHGGVLYMAGQQGLFAADEAAWDNDNHGRYIGPMPLRSVPAGLGLDGSVAEVATDHGGLDTIHRLPSGAPVTASASATEPHRTDTIDAEHFLLMDASTGAVTASADLASPSLAGTNRQALGAVADGCYVLASRFVSVLAAFRLPPGYTRDDASYLWGGDPEDYWDYTVNVGKLPPAGHSFYAVRAQLVANGTTQDRPEWADFIISDAAQAGEWSARRVIVGAGPWSQGAAVLPPCGASLYTIEGTALRTAVPLDLMARTGNVVYGRVSGTMLLAGQRLTPSGPVLALWEFDGASWTLLGVDNNPSTGICECGLANHGPTEVRETSDGVVYVLTKCSLHCYDPTGATLDERLPGVPIWLDGHPGGHSLRLHQGRLYFTTEHFTHDGDITTFVNDDGTLRAQFYDDLQVQVGEERLNGPGTVFHGACDLANWAGELWGVYQDKPFSDPTAQQFITWFTGVDWERNAPVRYPAAAFMFQRLCGTPGAIHNHLLVWGKRATDERGLVGLGDGETFTVGRFAYRIRRAVLSAPATGENDGKAVVLMVGRASSDNAIDATAWHIIESTGEPNEVLFNPGGGGGGLCVLQSDLAAAGVELADLPPWLEWLDNIKQWVARDAKPVNGHPYRQLVIGTDTACYVDVDGTGGPGGDGCNSIVLDILTGVALRVSVDGDGHITAYCDIPILPDVPAGSKVIVIRYTVQGGPAGGDPANAVQVLDASRERILETFATAHNGAIKARVDSADAGDLESSYTQDLPYSRWALLDVPATAHVDVWFYVPADVTWEEINPTVNFRN